MKCKVCGGESGKYVLCRECNGKKDAGEIIKCTVCNNWHHKDYQCMKTDEFPEIIETITNNENKNLSDKNNCGKDNNLKEESKNYLYEVKDSLLSVNESKYYNAIKGVIPNGYLVFPQINLASFINRMDDARFHNELFRNVDFLITDKEYHPKIIVEVNDRSHLTTERKIRDEKVQKICEEAGIPIIKLWTSYGVNPEYIRGKITEILNSLPVERICHSNNKENIEEKVDVTINKTTGKKGCYIATSIYGSYDCPNVWILRRYRDMVLDNSWYGKLFIKMYYSISPFLVKAFGKSKIFKSMFTKPLNLIVELLKKQGYKDTPYYD